MNIIGGVKNILILLLAAIFLSGWRAPAQTANPDANAKAKSILNYFKSLEARPDKRLLSGQFSDFGNGAS